MVRLDIDRALEECTCDLRLPGARSHDAEVDECVDVVRLQRDGFFQMLYRLVAPATRSQQQRAQVVLRGGEPRFVFHRRPVLPLGLGHPALRFKESPVVDTHLREFRLHVERFAVEPVDVGRRPACCFIRLRESVQPFWHARLQPNRFAEGWDGLLDAPALHPGEPEEVLSFADVRGTGQRLLQPRYTFIDHIWTILLSPVDDVGHSLIHLALCSLPITGEVIVEFDSAFRRGCLLRDSVFGADDADEMVGERRVRRVVRLHLRHVAGEAIRLQRVEVAQFGCRHLLLQRPRGVALQTGRIEIARSRGAKPLVRIVACHAIHRRRLDEASALLHPIRVRNNTDRPRPLVVEVEDGDVGSERLGGTVPERLLAFAQDRDGPVQVALLADVELSVEAQVCGVHNRVVDRVSGLRVCEPRFDVERARAVAPLAPDAFRDRSVGALDKRDGLRKPIMTRHAPRRDGPVEATIRHPITRTKVPSLCLGVPGQW